MMVLLAGEPSGKAGSFCKRCLRALILLFTSVCKMWVKDRPGRQGLVSLLHRSSAYLERRAALASSHDTSAGTHGILAFFCAARMQHEERIVNVRRRPS